MTDLNARNLYARVLIDLVQARIDNDKRTYRMWSVRAKLWALGLTALGTTSTRNLTHSIFPSSMGDDLRRTQRTERKYVRRAVPTAFQLAIREEMRQCAKDMMAREAHMWMVAGGTVFDPTVRKVLGRVRITEDALGYRWWHWQYWVAHTLAWWRNATFFRGRP